MKSRDWEKVIQHQSGGETPDNAEACVIECSGNGMAVLLVHTPFEPWDYASVDFRDVLTAEEGESLRRLIRENLWMPLEGIS